MQGSSWLGTAAVLASVFFIGCGQIVTNEVVGSPDKDLDPLAPPVQPRQAEISLEAQTTIHHADDVLEPNDEASDAFYLGAAPGTADFEAYLDERVVDYAVTVHNTGDQTASGFYVALFADADEAPHAPANGEDERYVDELATTGKTELAFSVTTGPGVYQPWVLADSADTVDEVDELNNAVGVSALEVVGDVDYFSFFQDATYDISLQLDCAACTGDYDLELFLGSNLIDASRNLRTDETIQVTAPLSGVYQVRVFSYDGALSSENSYRLRVELQ